MDTNVSERASYFRLSVEMAGSELTYVVWMLSGEKYPQLVTLPGISHEISILSRQEETTSSYFCAGLRHTSCCVTSL